MEKGVWSATTAVLVVIGFLAPEAMGDKITLSLPDVSWALEADAPGFVVEQREMAPTGEAVRIFAKDKKTDVLVSIFLEKVPDRIKTPQECRAYYLEKGGRAPLKYEDVKMLAHGEMAIIERTIKQMGPVTNQRNVNAFLVRDAYGVDIHLSKADYKPEDQALFSSFLQSVRFSDSYTPDTRTLYEFGSVFLSRKDSDKASRCFQQALDREQEHPSLDNATWKKLVLFLGVAYGQAGNIQKAEQVLEYGLSKEPEYPLFLYNMACVQAERGDLEQAMGSLKQAYRLKDRLLPGEAIPNPRTDSSFQKYLNDKTFQETIEAIRAAGNAELLPDIEKVIAQGDKAPASLTRSIADRIEGDPKGAVSALLPRIKAQDTREEALTVYIWALGLTKDQSTVEDIIKAGEGRTSELLKANVLKAVGTIGGPKAGAFLLAQLEVVRDRDTRFEVLNLLGQMQYEPALPKTMEVLETDPNEEWWRPIFVFGKMGDKGVAFLIERMGDKNRNVRVNAILVLGQYLRATEAAEPMRERFWKEADPFVRQLLLSALERTAPDPDAMTAFSQQVIAKEKDKSLVQFARGTLADVEKVRKNVASYRKLKKVDAEAFRREYEALYRSVGRGNYDALRAASTLEDEAKLKKLRERILQRNSDEALEDYEKVNDIITLNRLLK